MSLLKHLLLEVTEQKLDFLVKLFFKKTGLPFGDEYIYRELSEDREITALEYFKEYILSLDSSENNNYTQWIIRNLSVKKEDTSDHGIEMTSYYIGDIFHNMVVNSKVYFAFTYSGKEKINAIKDAIKTYILLKKNSSFPQEYKDINYFKDIDDFITTVKDYSSNAWKYKHTFEIIKEEGLKYGEDYTKEFEDEAWVILKPLNEKASCKIGSHSSWCTSAGEYATDPERKSSKNHFDSYPNHIIILNKKDKLKVFQFYKSETSYGS
jgi:nitrogen regulatory protein PII-like uncharacterized protein